MGPTVTRTYGSLIDEVLETLYRHEERPTFTTAAESVAADSTTLQVADASNLSVTDILEIGSELALITDIDAPELTLSRGYAGTTAAAVTLGDVLLKNPTHTRKKVGTRVQRSFGPISTFVHPVVAEEYTPSTLLLELPANTHRVENVRYHDETSGRIIDIGGWEFHYNLPTTVVSSRCALQLPSSVSTSDSLIVSRQIPYEWSDVSELPTVATTTDPAEEDTVLLPASGEDLPVVWAAASLALGYELTRQDLDTISEWDAEAARAQGVNLRLVQQLWGDYYRRIDEVQRTYPQRYHRPFQKMPKVP